MVGAIRYDPDEKQALTHCIFTRMLEDTVKTQEYSNTLVLALAFFTATQAVGPDTILSFGATVGGGAASCHAL